MPTRPKSGKTEGSLKEKWREMKLNQKANGFISRLRSLDFTPGSKKPLGISRQELTSYIFTIMSKSGERMRPEER